MALIGEIYMNFKGKAITGTSLLTMLGVVCFATILVAAAVLLGSANWTNNAVSGATVTKLDVASHGGDALIASPIVGKDYEFGIQVQGHADATGQLTINITKAGIAPENVILSYYNVDHWTALTANTGTSGSLLYTYPTTTALTASSDVTYDFQINYVASGSYGIVANVTEI
jgi:hypothetical protein